MRSFQSAGSSRRFCQRLLLLTGILCASYPEALLYAHGGLPISQQILRRGGATDTLYVSVLYWGLFAGKPGGPWKLICEEEINNNRLRRYGVSTDGTFYATDNMGVTASTDRGCTWKPYQGGELAALPATDLVTDPQDGATAYVTTGSSTADNGLFITHDHGATWIRAAGLGSLVGKPLLSVRVSPSDAQTLYVTGRSSAQPFSPTLYRSVDGGRNFTPLPITYLLDGMAPLATEVLAVDPRSARAVYLRAFSETRHALLRSIDGGATFAEVLKMDGSGGGGQSVGIDGVAVDTGRGQVYVATTAGLWRGDSPDPLSPAPLMLVRTGNLSQARCVDVIGGAVYACSSQFAPDFAAVARSQDGVQPFVSVLNYPETAGPIDCAAGTPVGDLCPAQWAMYKSQLGVGSGLPDADAGPNIPAPSCSHTAGSHPAVPPLVPLAALILLVQLSRRRYLRTAK